MSRPHLWHVAAGGAAACGSRRKTARRRTACATLLCDLRPDGSRVALDADWPPTRQQLDRLLCRHLQRSGESHLPLNAIASGLGARDAVFWRQPPPAAADRQPLLAASSDPETDCRKPPAQRRSSTFSRCSLARVRDLRCRRPQGSRSSTCHNLTLRRAVDRRPHTSSTADHLCSHAPNIGSLRRRTRLRRRSRLGSQPQHAPAVDAAAAVTATPSLVGSSAADPPTPSLHLGPPGFAPSLSARTLGAFRIALMARRHAGHQRIRRPHLGLRRHATRQSGP